MRAAGNGLEHHALAIADALRAPHQRLGTLVQLLGRRIAWNLDGQETQRPFPVWNGATCPAGPRAMRGLSRRWRKRAQRRPHSAIPVTWRARMLQCAIACRI